MIDRDQRKAIRYPTVDKLPLCPEGRECTTPTAAWVIEVFEPLSAYELLAGGEVLKRYDDPLSIAIPVRRLLGLSAWA